MVLIALEVAAEDICKDPGQSAIILFNHSSYLPAHISGALGSLCLAVRQKDTSSRECSAIVYIPVL